VREAARSLVFGAVAACLLLWVALYNGYPTVYPDTASYIYTGAFHIPLPPFRSPGYSVFIARTSFGASPWFTIVAQAIAVVAALYGACKYLVGGNARFRDHCLLAITAALAALTSLPWFTSLLMPDVFAGVAFLALFLLGFEARLHWAERIALAAIATLAVGAHISLMPIAMLFVAAVAIVKLVRRLPPWTPSAKAMLPWLAAPLVIAGLWTAQLNRSMALGFRLSPSGDEYLMGRLLEDGLAGDFLRANCPNRSFAACRYLNDLPKTPEQFLFWHPLLSEMELNGNEVHEVAWGTLAAYPVRFAWNSTRHTLRQFVQLRTGDEVRGLALGAPNGTGTMIQRVFPRDAATYANSKLIRGRLVSPTKVAAVVDAAAFWLSALACIIFAVQRRQGKWNWLFYSAIAYLFFNAAVCATLAGVYDRYQSRVAWLIPLCLAICLCERYAGGTHEVGVAKTAGAEIAAN
jgi:hypothetical protein